MTKRTVPGLPTRRTGLTGSARPDRSPALKGRFVAGHRAPRGRGRHGRRGAATGAPSARTAVLATAAAVGAVATGTLTALIPVPGDGATTSAASDEAPVAAALSSNPTPLDAAMLAAGPLSPVALPIDEPAPGFAAADQHLALLGKGADMAAQLAEQHAQQQREQADGERFAALIERGGLDAWIAEALDILDLPQALAPGVKKIIMAESGGNPRAINNWDSNARRGTPSQGLMQTIPSTFRAYVHPAVADRSITDPVANITAGIRYMIAHYGLDTLAAGGRSNGSGDYVGY